MASLVADISANGVREPILLGDDGRVWDGHHRICAAIELNLTELPVAQHHRPQGGPS
jgi:ParB-like chromosome segregation protein Spo0J